MAISGDSVPTACTGRLACTVLSGAETFTPAIKRKNLSGKITKEAETGEPRENFLIPSVEKYIKYKNLKSSSLKLFELKGKTLSKAQANPRISANEFFLLEEGF